VSAASIEVDFRSGGNSDKFEKINFSFSEPLGTWNNGRECAITVPRPARYAQLELQMVVVPHLITGKLSAQQLSIAANGTQIYCNAISDSATIRVRLPSGVLAKRESIILSFRCPDSVSPLSCGVSGDNRILGVMFRRLSIVNVEDTHGAMASPGAGGCGPVLHIEGPGQLANQMIKYMVALNLASRVPGLRISGVSMPEWGISHPEIPSAGREFVVEHLQHFDLAGVADLLNSGSIERVVYRGYGQRLENFLPREKYLDVFPDRFHNVMVFGPDDLVIHIRGADIFAAAHRDYPLIPVAFYQDVVRLTGLRPVFLGQIEPNDYTDALRAAFPTAQFLPPQDRMQDFETMRRATNILTAVSTFSWMAAWLSRAEQIFLPVDGLFHPMQVPGVDLTPTDDGRFRFFLFPVNYAVPISEYRTTHDAIRGLWREVTGDMVRDIRRGARLLPRRLEDFEAAFDEEHYLTAHPSARTALSQGEYSSALDHYRRVGFAQGLSMMSLDADWYVRSYPIAALEVGQGDFAGFEHHYAAIGRRRGYLPQPDTQRPRTKTHDNVVPLDVVAGSQHGLPADAAFQSLPPSRTVNG
jgi:hypothetical protein